MAHGKTKLAHLGNSSDKESPIDVVALGFLGTSDERSTELVHQYRCPLQANKHRIRHFRYVPRCRGSARYKDEDEFAEAIEAGIFTEFEAQKVRDAAAQALQTVAENRKPFNSAWGDWRPDILWEIPQIPKNWDDV